MQYQTASTRISGTTMAAGRPATVLGSSGFGSSGYVSGFTGTTNIGFGTTVSAPRGAPMVSSIRQPLTQTGRAVRAGNVVTPTSPTNMRVISGSSYGTYGGNTLLASTKDVGYVSALSPTNPRVISAPAVRTAPTTTVVSNGRVGTTVRQANILSGGISGASAQYITSPTTILSGGYATGSAIAPRVISVQAAAPLGASTGLSGPQATVAAYESKHADDAKLSNLKELKRNCGLKKVPVKTAANAFKAAAAGTGFLTHDQFFVAHSALLDSCGVEHPPPEVKSAVYDLFDRNDDGCVDMMEIICGISLLCKGSEDDKVEAVFMMFDENGDGYVSVDEMYKFLTVVFKVVCTPNVMSVVSSVGVTVDSTDDMASATTMECFETADLNHDGKLSLAEFKKWFYAPRNDPTLLFQPVKQMLN